MPPKTPAIPVPVDQFIAGDARKGVAVAGLLAHKPELTEPDKDGAPKQLPHEEWQAELDTYLSTPIDPPPAAPEPVEEPAT